MSQQKKTRPAQEKQSKTSTSKPKDLSQKREQTQEELDDLEKKIDEVLEENEAKDKKTDMDDLIDEIDEVLEEDAEAFVKAFIQRGGE